MGKCIDGCIALTSLTLLVDTGDMFLDNNIYKQVAVSVDSIISLSIAYPLSRAMCEI